MKKLFDWIPKKMIDKYDNKRRQTKHGQKKKRAKKKELEYLKALRNRNKELKCLIEKLEKEIFDNIPAPPH